MDLNLLTNLGLLFAIIGLLVSAWLRYARPVHLTDSRTRSEPQLSSDGKAPDALRLDGRRIPTL